MHIGLVLSQPPGYSETFFTSKIKGLINSGHKVTLFCQSNNTDFNLCPIKVMPSRSKNIVMQVFQIKLTLLTLLPHLRKVQRFVSLEKEQGLSMFQIIKKVYLNTPLFKSDLDWVHFGFATMALDRELVPLAIDAKCAVSFRGFDIAIYPVKHPNCYDLLWTCIDKVHTISDDLLQLAYGIGLPKHVEFQKITPAIDVDKFSPKSTSKIGDKPIKMLSVARLHWKKGLIDTLEALAILKSKGIDFEYTIVGTGDQREELEFAIYQLGLKNNVHVLGRKEHHEVITLMDEASVYLQYSQSEGFCNAVLEAQAMRLLCVVSDAEGLSENVLHEVTGFVVPKHQPKLLASTLLGVLDFTDQRDKELRNNAQQRVRDQFNLKKQAEAFKEFYN